MIVVHVGDSSAIKIEIDYNKNVLRHSLEGPNGAIVGWTECKRCIADPISVFNFVEKEFGLGFNIKWLEASDSELEAILDSIINLPHSEQQTIWVGEMAMFVALNALL